jgi:hypothetical protein
MRRWLQSVPESKTPEFSSSSEAKYHEQAAPMLPQNDMLF